MPFFVKSKDVLTVLSKQLLSSKIMKMFARSLKPFQLLCPQWTKECSRTYHSRWKPSWEWLMDWLVKSRRFTVIKRWTTIWPRKWITRSNKSKRYLLNNIVFVIYRGDSEVGKRNASNLKFKRTVPQRLWILRIMMIYKIICFTLHLNLSQIVIWSNLIHCYSSLMFLYSTDDKWGFSNVDLW